MFYRSKACGSVLAAALIVAWVGAQAADEAKYPNWKGQWQAINPPLGDQIIKFDPTKRSGPWQQAPLTPEYQRILEDSMADQAKGGLGNIQTRLSNGLGWPRKHDAS